MTWRYSSDVEGSVVALPQFFVPMMGTAIPGSLDGLAFAASFG